MYLTRLKRPRLTPQRGVWHREIRKPCVVAKKSAQELDTQRGARCYNSNHYEPGGRLPGTGRGSNGHIASYYGGSEVRRSMVGIALAVPLLGRTAQAHGAYTILDRGAALGGNWSTVRGINDSGQLAGRANTPSGILRAFLFDSGTTLPQLGKDKS